MASLLRELGVLREHEPRVYLALAAASAALVVSILIPLLGLDGYQPSLPASWFDGSAEAIDKGGEAAPGGIGYSSAGSAAASVPDPADAAALVSEELLPLSEVLREGFDETKLIYGSDGSEGSLIPLGDGVVASSRWKTKWELILPSAGIRASVVQVGLTPGGAMGSPDNPNVIGWFNQSAMPGQPGNALLGGHRDYHDAQGETGIGVCWLLGRTKVGDQLVMHDQQRNKYYIYDIVEAARYYPRTADEVRYLSQTRESVVTLITCAGQYDERTRNYEERLVVVGLLSAVASPDA